MIYQIQKGNLDGRIMPFLLYELSSGKMTGMLSIRKDEQRKFLFFERGEICFVQSSLPNEQLGKQMLHGGAINDEQYGKLHDLVREGGWKNPEIGQLGYVSGKTIEWWLKSLIREVVMSILPWDSGEYRFITGKKAPVTCPTVHMNTSKIIFSCIRRLHNPRILVPWLADLDAVPKINHSVLLADNSGLNLTPQEGFFASRIDGSMTYRQLLSMGGKQRLEMLQFIVAALITGLITSGARESFHLKKPQEDSSADPAMNSSTTARDVSVDNDTDKIEKEELEKPSTEDVFLTKEELEELEELAGSQSLFKEQDDVTVQDLLRNESVELDAKISYLRDGQFVESGVEGSLDISTLKTVEKGKGREDIDEDKLTILIGDDELDAESSLIGETAFQEIFSSSSAEEQWDKWITTTVEETDEDFLVVWEKSWKSWEDQAKELAVMKEEQKELEAKLEESEDDSEKEIVRKRYNEITREYEQRVGMKKREILVTYRRAQIQTYYEILRLPENADSTDIKTAYFKWLSEYQPDQRYLRDFESIIVYLNKLVDTLHEAYEILSNEEDRASYNANLERKRKAAEAIDAKKKLLAEDHLVSGREAMKRGDVMLAMRFIRGSISLDPRNSKYYKEMAEMLSSNPQWSQESMRFYHRAFHLDPKNVNLLISVAKLSATMGLRSFGERALKQALDIKPGDKRLSRLLAEIKKS
jgi:Domain of unknown function (DUF4388)/DnaJ domain